MTEKLKDVEIMAFVDGTLEPEEEKRIEKLLSQDEDARQTAQYMRSSNTVLQKFSDIDLGPTESFVSEFKAKQAQVMSKSANDLSSYSPDIVSKAANNNFLKPLLSLAACLGLVFFVSDDIHQLVQKPLNGKVIYNVQSGEVSPKTRSTKTPGLPIKELTFSPWSGDYIKLKIEIFGNGHKTAGKARADGNNFVIYKDWVQKLTGFIGLSLGDRVEITIGERINFNVKALTAGSVSFQIKPENSASVTVFQNQKVGKDSSLDTGTFEAEPPAERGEFIIEFAPQDGQPKKFQIPFELLKK